MGERLTGDYRSHMDKPYLGHWDIPGPDDLIVTIDHIERCEIKSQRGTDHKPTAFFRERGVKPMILNATNHRTIAKVMKSPLYEDWEGRKIAIYAGDESRAEDGKALRVREYAPRVTEPICADCGEPITDAVISGKRYRAKAVAESSRSRFGRTLCAVCAQLAKEKEEQEEQSTAYEDDLNREVANELEGLRNGFKQQ